MSPKKRSGRSPGNPAGKSSSPASEPQQEEDPGTVWITTEIGPDEKTYSVVLNWEDTSTTISFDRAVKYAQEVLRAAHRAAYDAAVVRELTAVDGIEQQAVAELIADMRQDRPPLNEEASRPLSFVPGVNKELNPFLRLSIDGKEVGQWDYKDAVEHAVTMLGLVAVAELDTLYFQGLQRLVGLPPEVAANMVSDLANYRDEAWA
jgi:hypothetical protein